MKGIIPILFAGYVLSCNIPLAVTAQEINPSSIEQQLENLTEADQAETEDDSRLQLMVGFKNDPVNLNTATIEELQQLQFFSGLQIASFLSYRKLLGKFINIYELQAIPVWDIITIKKILPFVTIGDPVDVSENWRRRFRNGRHSFLFRFAQTLEKSTGYTTRATGNYYLGSPQKLFFRYRYQYKNLLQYGILGDKDAGEPFFGARQRYGFDFYSFHLFIRRANIIQSLAIGDFTVNFGQGLIQWQSLAFGKGVEISGIKRQSPILKPYNSAGEYNFHRGIGITMRRGNMETTAFASIRKINANFITDTVSNGLFVSSFLTSGYNRTAGEQEDRNSLRQIAIGGNISWTLNRFHLGLNSISYTFSLPIQKRPEPYNLFAINGKS